MENKKEKEVWGRLPSKNRTLQDLNISEDSNENSKLKNEINSAIFKAIDKGRPKSEIEILINAGDIIDSLCDQLSEG